MLDISCHVFHDLWPSKGVIFAKFLSENISKNLKILCQCEYASPDNLWQFMGTAWAWQCRHIRLEYALRRYFRTNLVRIGVNFRDFKLIEGRINWSYCNPLFCAHWQWPVVWLGIAFISKCMWRQLNYDPAMASSWFRSEQELGSHLIWPCLWLHKWIITTPINELDSMKGSLGHRFSIWSGHCRGRSCQSMLNRFMLIYPRNCVQLMWSCRHGNWCDITSLCRTQRIYISWINEVIKRWDVTSRT